MSSSHMRVGFGALALAALGSSVLAQSPYQAAFTSDVDYSKTFFLTPNGFVNLAGPMVRHMLGGGDAIPGGGTYTKVGIVAALYYSQQTQGANFDFKYDIRDSAAPPSNPPSVPYSIAEIFSLPLPPDVVSMNDLPALVRFGPDGVAGGGDDLAPWATLAKMPAPIAALEWARYLDLPISVQMQSTVSQSGVLEPSPSAPVFDLDRAFERGDLGPTPSTPISRRAMCMWDVSNVTDAFDNDPGTAEPDNVLAPQFTFASVSIASTSAMSQVTGLPANKCYRSYVTRNMKDAVEQFLAIASLPRYAGHVAAFAIDPEVHLPEHSAGHAGSSGLPQHPSYGSALIDRCFLEDYNPATCLQFAQYEQARYGDSTPLADDNFDGKYFAADFGSDYVTSGWPGINSHSTVPATWNQIDPPRLYPHDINSPRSAYWHEWINFRVAMLDDYVQELVTAMANATVPANRIFTHQTGAGSSTTFTRAEMDPTPGSIFNNSEWLDDWQTMEVSRGTMGTSIYGWGGVDCDTFLYDNLRARGDAWGAPEYNPAVVPCNPGVTDCVSAPVNKAYAAGARILWPHAWDSTTEPLFAYRYNWNFTNSSNANWTPVNLTPSAPYMLPTGGGASYYENTTALINTSLAKYIAVNIAVLDNTGTPANTLQLPLRIDFRQGGTWYTAQKNILRSWTIDSRWVTLDMSGYPNWTGTVDGLRIYVAPSPVTIVKLDRVLLPVASTLTTAFKNLMTANKNNVRAEFPSSTLPVVTPFDLTAQVPSAQCDQGNGRVTIYGTDPVTGPACTSGNTNVFSNFCVAGNFEPKTVAQGGIQCGNVVRAGLRSPAATWLGLHKTGKFHKLQLPDLSDLYLSFRIGIEDQASIGGDGVRFRVLVRGADGKLAAQFDREWRSHAWSDVQFVSLNAYRNQVVDIAFEVHGISNSTGDLSAWGEPRIVRAFSVATAALGFGQTTPNPSALFVENEPGVIQAIEGPNWTFHHWQAPAGLTLGNPNAASTTVTATMGGTATAVFVQTSTFTSIAAEDGRTRESIAGSGIGGSSNDFDADGLALRIGDDSTDRRYRSILSFDTDSIPTGSTIVEAYLELSHGGLIGLSPPAGDTKIRCTVSNVPFGSVLDPVTFAPRVEAADFESVGSGAAEGGQLAVPSLPISTYVVPFNATGLGQIRFGVPPGPSVRTQVKLWLTGTNAVGANDVLGLYPGEASTTNRPRLIVKYY